MRIDDVGPIDVVEDEEGRLEFQVPSKRVSRLIQLGVHVEREQRLRAARRRISRQSRRRNRRK